MRKQELHREKIDAIGKRLIGHSMLSDSEIDKIVASPTLYSSIRNRVNATPVEKPKFAWLRVRTVAAFSSILVVVGISAFVVLRQDETIQTIVRTNQVVPTPVNRVPDGFSEKLDAPEVEEIPRREPPRMEIRNVSYRKPAATNARHRTRVESQPDLEFIPLVYAGDPAETVRGGRVIRVELSRSSLFAMGINVPLENGAEMVKADLLVGADGVPRAIRMPH